MRFSSFAKGCGGSQAAWIGDLKRLPASSGVLIGLRETSVMLQKPTAFRRGRDRRLL